MDDAGGRATGDTALHAHTRARTQTRAHTQSGLGTCLQGSRTHLVQSHMTAHRGATAKKKEEGQHAKIK